MPTRGKTIKQLVVQALLDAFPNGATTIEMRDFFRSGYGRTVDPSSLRTQLHRMKAAGIVSQDTSKDSWNFCTGQRALFDTYRQTTPTNGMRDLQDETEPSEEDEAFLKKVEALAWREEDSKK